MDINQAKEELKAKYNEAGFPVQDSNAELVIINGKDSSLILEEDIQKYSTVRDKLVDFSQVDYACGISNEDSVELLLAGDIFAGSTFSSELWFGEPLQFGQISSNVHAFIGGASEEFKNYFRFHKSYIELCFERSARSNRGMFGLAYSSYLSGLASLRQTPAKTDLNKFILYEPTTISVRNILTGPGTQAVTIRLIEAILFNFTYSYDIVATLAEEWPSKKPPTDPFKYKPSEDYLSPRTFRLPSSSFNSDLIRFYHRGISSNDPFSQFITYYHILEYFFIKVSDESLYATLSATLNDPSFHMSPIYLDKLIRGVQNHKSETDEKAMLEQVIKKYVTEDEITQFIKTYENHLGRPMFTRKRNVFGKDLQISLMPGHVIGTLATYIKAIRNALVHSSDRHERTERFIPGRRSDEDIEIHLPLLRFLAEKVIIGSALPLEL